MLPFDEALPFGGDEVDRSLVERLRVLAEQRRDQPAIADADGGQVFTFGRLAPAVEDAGRWLHDHLGADGRPVAVMMPHVALTVASELAVIVTGRAVAPLEPEAPDRQLREVIEDVDSAVIVATSGLATRARSVADGRPVIVWDDLPEAPVDPPSLPPTDGRSPAFLLYTSGSSGRPKGVMSNQRAFTSGARELALAGVFRPDDRVAMVVPLTFAAAACQTLWPLLAGAEVVLYPLRERGLPAFTEWMKGAGIAAFSGVPTLVRAVSTLLGDEQLADLRVLVVGGEAVQRSDVPLMRRMSRRPLDVVPVYASTEMMLISWQVIPAESELADMDRVHIGNPVEGRTIELVPLDGDDDLGEIVVNAPVLSSGYWRRPELNAEMVEIDEAVDRMRMRTGDVGRRVPGGIEIVGRTDSMAKVRGFRVELGAVESILLGAPEVGAAAVTIVQHGVERRLIAHVAPVEGGVIDRGVVRAHVRERAPSYMVPSRIVVHGRIPVLANGKVDRAWLEANSAQRSGSAPSSQLTLTERQLVKHLAEVVDDDAVGVDDEVVDLGLDSLVAVDLLVFVEEQFGVRVPVSAWLDFRTLADLADHIDRRLEGRESGHGRGPVLIQAGDPGRPPLLVAHDLHGTALRFRDLARAIGDDQLCWGMDSPLLEGDGAVAPTLAAMAAHQIRLVRERFPTGPYHLLGYSFGTLLVTEMVAQLERAGAQVGFVGLIDFGPVHIRHRTRRREGPRPPGGWPERAPSDLPLARRVAYHLDAVRNVEPDQRVHYVSRALDVGRPYDLWLARRDLRRTGRVRPRLRAAWNWYCEMEMAFDFGSPPLRSDAVVFLSDQTAKGKMDVSRRLDFTSATDPRLGWDRVYQGGVSVLDVVGHHNDLVEDPYVRGVGAAVRKAFDRRIGVDGGPRYDRE